MPPWWSFLDPWGNRHLITVLDWPLPGGGSIRLLVWLMLPSGGTTPVVVLVDIAGSADPTGFRQHVAALADYAGDLLAQQVPELEGTPLRWLVQHRESASALPGLTDVFHELRFVDDAGSRRLEAVRRLDAETAEEIRSLMRLGPLAELGLRDRLPVPTA